jgi:hypothetical protein
MFKILMGFRVLFFVMTEGDVNCILDCEVIFFVTFYALPGGSDRIGSEAVDHQKEDSFLV